MKLLNTMRKRGASRAFMNYLKALARNEFLYARSVFWATEYAYGCFWGDEEDLDLMDLVYEAWTLLFSYQQFLFNIRHNKVLLDLLDSHGHPPELTRAEFLESVVHHCENYMRKVRRDQEYLRRLRREEMQRQACNPQSL